MVTIDATVGDGRTLHEFAKLLEARQKYLNESTEDACAAIAIDALKSIRAATRVATDKSVEKGVKVEQVASLYPSFKSVGKKKIFCLRYKGSKKEYKGGARIVETERNGNVTDYGVFSFNLETDKASINYLIVSPNAERAKERAKKIQRRAGMMFAGLARRALTILMMKTATIKDNDGDSVSSDVSNKANELTQRVETKSGNMLNATYSLLLEDNLDYASGAVKGGESGVNLALQKAMNKVASVINHKCEKLLMFEKLETPFPEVKQRK